MTTGRLFGLGVGPGDPELLTLKALRLLQASPAIAYFAAGGRKGNAYSIVEQYLRPGQELLRLQYPVTREKPPDGQSYEEVIARFYDHSAARVSALLDKGEDVAVICEGDPLFYGSYMYLHDRLAGRYDAEVVPGISSVFAGAAVLGTPLVYRNQTLSVLSGVLAEDELRQRLQVSEAAVIMKLGGGNLDKARRVLGELGLLDRALYVERATMEAQRIVPLEEVDAETSPYFSLILVPGRKWQS